jgi:hypothetical protein
MIQTVRDARLEKLFDDATAERRDTLFRALAAVADAKLVVARAERLYVQAYKALLPQSTLDGYQLDIRDARAQLTAAEQALTTLRGA